MPVFGTLSVLSICSRMSGHRLSGLAKFGNSTHANGNSLL